LGLAGLFFGTRCIHVCNRLNNNTVGPPASSILYRRISMKQFEIFFRNLLVAVVSCWNVFLLNVAVYQQCSSHISHSGRYCAGMSPLHDAKSPVHTVAENGDCCRKRRLRQSPFSVTNCRRNRRRQCGQAIRKAVGVCCRRDSVFCHVGND